MTIGRGGRPRPGALTALDVVPFVPDDVARVVLVRHGETDYNREGRWQGAGSDPPLNEQGRVQARQIARDLARVPFIGLYTSDLERARETARIIGEVLGLEPRVLEGLGEMSHGAWEGKTLPAILEAWGDAYRTFEADPWNERRPEGDSYGDLAERVWPALDALANRHRGERALVITHGGPIRLVLSELTGTPLTRRDELGVDNGTWFAVEKHGPDWRLADSL